MIYNIYTCSFKINFGKKLINDDSNLMNKIVTRLKYNSMQGPNTNTSFYL